MARETKVGLLVGMVIILVIGIIVSDHLSVVHHQVAAPMEGFGNIAQNSVEGQPNTPPTPVAQGDQSTLGQPVPANRVVPVPMPGETINAIDRTTPQDQNSQPTTPRIADAGEPPAPLAVHVVKHGDTIYRIVRTYYKNDVAWTTSAKLIEDANRGSIGPKGQLRDGTKLVIPKPAVPDELKKTGLLVDADPNTSSGTDGTAPVKLMEVRKGQTLRSIAQDRLGDSRRAGELLRLNSDQLHKESDLRPGMVIRLPATTGSASNGQPVSTVLTPTIENSSAQTTIKTTDNAPARTYTVKSGDTLVSIAARQLGSAAKADDIYRLNRKTLANKNQLKVGQVLILSSASSR